jgi:FAD/FMN-containing dehydrogenase
MTSRSPGWDPGFGPQDVDALVSVTHGPVLLAGSADIEDELSRYDRRAVCEPDVVVGAADTADVVAAVRFAAGFGLPLAVLSPGHEHAEPVKSGLVLTTGRLGRIHVDHRGRSAIAGAGALWGDVVDRAAEVGLAPLVLAAPQTSVVGSVYGWTAGHVLAIEYVTPDAHLSRVTARSHPHLFRWLCGSEPGDTAAGVVTAMEFALFR